MPGALYVVSTPIGNLSDITLRALEVLRDVDAIACENRERHLKLLNHYNIKNRLLTYSPANEKNSVRGIIKLLQEDKNIALVSDAGAPGISDPGALLIEEAVNNSIKVIPIPGVSALTAVLSAAGKSFKRIVFLGFLPKTAGGIERELKKYNDFTGAIVLFINARHVKNILILINKIFGDVEIIIGREMTKINEEFIRGRVSRILISGIEERGEFSLLIYNRVKK
jgi:16S rRNA (cytidine1402-2'-O)-methyltransferase